MKVFGSNYFTITYKTKAVLMFIQQRYLYTDRGFIYYKMELPSYWLQKSQNVNNKSVIFFLFKWLQRYSAYLTSDCKKISNTIYTEIWDILLHLNNYPRASAEIKAGNRDSLPAPSPPPLPLPLGSCSCSCSKAEWLGHLPRKQRRLFPSQREVLNLRFSSMVF